ncbi:ORF V: Enzymatic polyprotein [Labeo rohita]|uniref:ORF V: Enzymatic polyprotein n=3 Tax=Labeonini TaxID=2743697 RepID=A0ABQ8LZ73_LABRO|nr:ORF V: Enzymatic polyprotein [Labeo rohita]
MASSAAVTPLGLMHMRPLQHWLHTRVPRWAWHQGTSRVNITPSCRQTLSPWTDIVFLWSGVPLEQVSRRIVVTTDASKIGWGATCDGQAASGVWTGPRLFWHINCLELLAVLLALRRFRPRIQGKHVLVRSDNTATVAYINHQGDVRSFRMSQLARHLLLWSQHRLKSLRTTHIPGGTNRRDGSLCLTGIHPLPVVTWSDRGPPRVRRTGTQLAEGLAQVCVSSSEPHRTNFVQSQGGQGTDSLGGPLLAQQNLVLRPGAPGISPSLVHSSEGGPPFSGEGHILAPAPQSLEPPPMVPGRDQEDFRDLFLQWAWTGTYLHLHSGFMSQPYQLTMTWWAADRWGNTIRYQVSERSSEPSSAASNPLLGSCCGSPRRLFLTALTSIKSGRPPGPLREQFVPGIRTSGFSRCLETPAWIRAQGPHHSLQRSGDDLASYSSQEDDPNLTYVMPSPCPAHLHGTNSALEMFGTALVCYGGQQKGKVVSKQRISHWLANAIWMAYRARGLPCPLEVRVHSTRGVAASAALANGASLTDICRVAGFLNANPGHHSIIGTPDVAEFGGGTCYEISTQGMVTSLTLGWICAPYVVAPHVVAPCVYFPPITPVVVNSVVPFPSGNRHFPNVLKTLSRSTEEGPAAGHCCNRSVLDVGWSRRGELHLR